VHVERNLMPSPFPDDDGLATAELRAALADAQSGDDADRYLRAVAALCAERLLVPVVATTTEVGNTTGPGGTPLEVEKESEMAVVLLQAADGSRALLAFSGMDALQSWNPQARPVPVTLDVAAQSATSDGAMAVIVDFAGPYPLVIEGQVLAALAEGHRLMELPDGQFGWAIPQLPASGPQPTE
jgi:hypothetical protein